MKVKIRTKTYVDKFIDVEFPYYYRHDLGSDYGDYTIYGRIDGEIAEVIEERVCYVGDEVSYTINRHKTDGSYFDEEYKSDESEFNNAFQKVQSFIESLQK